MATAIEYGLIGGLISVVIIASVDAAFKKDFSSAASDTTIPPKNYSFDQPQACDGPGYVVNGKKVTVSLDCRRALTQVLALD